MSNSNLRLYYEERFSYYFINNRFNNEKKINKEEHNSFYKKTKLRVIKRSIKMTKRRVYNRMVQLKEFYINRNIYHKRIINSELYKKNNLWIEKVNQKKEERRNKIEESKLKECSFKPKLVSKYSFCNNLNVSQKEKITYFKSQYTNMKLSFLERTKYYQQFQKERMIQISRKYNNIYVKKRKRQQINKRRDSIYNSISHKIDNNLLTNGKILLKKLDDFIINFSSKSILKEKENLDLILSSVYLIIQENRDLDLL